jgi:hypothetical protein
LLPSAEPAGTSAQLDIVDVIARSKGSGIEHAASLKMAIEPAQALPVGALHAHAEQPRVSSIPP